MPKDSALHYNIILNGYQDKITSTAIDLVCSIHERNATE
jgi:hypothetical protein